MAVSALILSISFLVSSISALNTLAALPLPDELKHAGQYQFLTNIALSLSTAYAAINIYHSLTGKASTLKEYSSATVLPLNFIVSLVYWSLRICFTNLIIADNVEKYIPLSLDLKIHLLPLLYTALDYFLLMDPWSIDSKTAYIIVSSLAILYWAWLHLLMDESSSYPYPFLNVSTGNRILICVLISLIAFATFLSAKRLHPARKLKNF